MLVGLLFHCNEDLHLLLLFMSKNHYFLWKMGTSSRQTNKQAFRSSDIWKKKECWHSEALSSGMHVNCISMWSLSSSYTAFTQAYSHACSNIDWCLCLLGCMRGERADKVHCVLWQRCNEWVCFAKVLIKKSQVLSSQNDSLIIQYYNTTSCSSKRTHSSLSWLCLIDSLWMIWVHLWSTSQGSSKRPILSS